MIPSPVVTAWRSVVNWPLDDQVEQDLLISVCLVKIFSEPSLKDKLAFRGGTAIHKLMLEKSLRYSEDIDLNRMENSPAGPTIDAIKRVLRDVFSGRPQVRQNQGSVKIIFKYPKLSGAEGKLKIEINVRETIPAKPLQSIPFEVNSPFFTGNADLQVFDFEEMVGTKIRALYQREKGRDLFDLYKLSENNLVNWDEVARCFLNIGLNVSAQTFQENLDLKMQRPAFKEDVTPLIPNDVDYDPQDAYTWFCRTIIPLLP